MTSFLLVVYFQRRKSHNAGILTALTNRLGDALILVAIVLALYEGLWDLLVFPGLDLPSGVIVLLLTVAACTKRAQLPFSA